MSTVLYVMLIWGGSVHSSPTVVQNFTSLESCERNRPFIELGFKSLNSDGINTSRAVKTVCMALVDKLN